MNATITPTKPTTASSTSKHNVERTIRRIAGTMVLASLALGWWVHPAWLLVAAFVGTNLLQSSFTGFCPLENMLKRGRSAADTSPGVSG